MHLLTDLLEQDTTQMHVYYFSRCFKPYLAPMSPRRAGMGRGR